ncbi:MAG TPA: hypothetical protein VNO51_07375 [Ilumatobacteraceae bacterium]|nr:hypothetical protein [Ilumatobacteraceae bacterium]
MKDSGWRTSNGSGHRPRAVHDRRRNEPPGGRDGGLVVTPKPELSAPEQPTGNLKQTERGVGRRLSVPFFNNANWDAEVVCLVGPGESPHHPPVTAGRHLMAKFRSTVT